MAHSSTCIVCDGDMPEDNLVVCGRDCYLIYKTRKEQGWHIVGCRICDKAIWTKDRRDRFLTCESQVCKTKMYIRRSVNDRNRGLKMFGRRYK